MVTSNNQKDLFSIIIPVSGIGEIQQYQRSILNILGKVNLDDCDAKSIQHVEVVYALLRHLAANEKRISELV